ncbi:hypothetical protein HMI54_009550 [Coelomomyces lativittatus]|nr:hypothetical protein HMI56_006298 [Coelomomyces lativittatus]KAJ1518187.1 hypothetical protein HMI55_001874 [Coelomomyces lativittatus]KAJ1518723.1 hypothetical protein HMI54_009550 [Coelomomyces lativittatus]
MQGLKAHRFFSRCLSVTSGKPPLHPFEEMNFSSAQLQKLSEILRVNQAGEIGANYIYQGQLAIFRKDPELTPLIDHMWDQEKKHLDTFNEYIPKFRARPSVLQPLWQTAGYVAGVTSALLGKEAAMACTEAVETVIGNHYNDQLRELMEMINEDKEMTLEKKKALSQLAEIIRQFRDDELQHLDTAVLHDAHKAPLYNAMNFIIQSGCKIAIEVAKRI